MPLFRRKKAAKEATEAAPPKKAAAAPSSRASSGSTTKKAASPTRSPSSARSASSRTASSRSGKSGERADRPRAGEKGSAAGSKSSSGAARSRATGQTASRSRGGASRSASTPKSGDGNGRAGGSRASESRGEGRKAPSRSGSRQSSSSKPKADRSRSEAGGGGGKRRPPQRRPLTTDEIAAISEPKHMVVHVGQQRSQIAILEGRDLVEHFTTRSDHSSIAGNIYLGKVQNVLPGMEAAFVDIGTPKNGVLYVGDVQWDEADLDPGAKPKIEQVLSKGQSVMVQVTKDPMGTKGARLTTQISLPGRFLVLVPESNVKGISRRLPDAERERLRRISKSIKPDGFGLIIRTAAQGASEEALAADVERLRKLWFEIYESARSGQAPIALYAEPELVIKVFRESFGPEFKKVTIDDKATYDRVIEFLDTYAPDLKEKVECYQDSEMSLFDRFHVTQQLQKALDRKVWLASGGHIIIDRTEALTVIDVNTGKNVGKSNLEETVFQNNLEAAEEISRQLRLRDIGGIIVIDFIDMEIRKNRQQVLETFRDCLAKDKTRTQVFDISELGLLEMTRKNVSEGIVEAYSHVCEACSGRGVIFEEPD